MNTFEKLEADIAAAKNLPECRVCRKKSDGAKTLAGHVLCGSHYDEGLRACQEAEGDFKLAVEKWILSQRIGKYAACWGLEAL